MTTAPVDLTAVAQFLVDATPLQWGDMGIVGDSAHAATGGYHEGNDDLSRVGALTSDYSKRESTRDRPGTNNASALDIGWWTGSVGKRGLTRLQFNTALVAACRAGDSRTRDIREVIYTPDGSTVRRWDRLGVRSTGDSSHLYHTHLSCFRDSEGRRDRADNLLGLITDLIDGVSTMNFLDDPNAASMAFRIDAMAAGSPTARGGPRSGEPVWVVDALNRLLTGQSAEAARDAALKTTVETLAGVLGGNGAFDVTAFMARINDAIHTAVAPLEEQVATLRHALAEAQRAAATVVDQA